LSQITNDNPPKRWFQFTGGKIDLYNVSRTNGGTGLLLRADDQDCLERLRQMAGEMGFLAIANQQTFYLPTRNKGWDRELRQLVREFGGKEINLASGDESNSSISLTEIEWDEHQNPHLVDDRKPPGLQYIGQNSHGIDIFNDFSGNRYSKKNNREGVPVLHLESRDHHHTYYLRAKSIEDSKTLAASILHMARDHSIRESDFRDLMSAALEREALEEGEPNETEFMAAIKEELVEQLLQQAVENSGNRKSYHTAVRMAQHLGPLIETDPDSEEGLLPSINLLILLKRLTRQDKEIDYLGTGWLAKGLPRIYAKKNVQTQVYDLTTSRSEQLAERIANILGQREAEGRSLFFVSDEASSRPVGDIRHEIGKTYTFEIVAEIQPHVAIGNYGGDPTTLLIIGSKRVHVDQSVPEAVKRTFKVDGLNDLDRLYQEVLRSKKRIIEWEEEHQKPGVGAEDLEENDRQRIYVPLSKVSKTYTMIPKALENSTTIALSRVAKVFEKEGGVDCVVAKWLGKTEEELAQVLIAEQVDAIAMAEVARRRNRGFLLADQTGIGKGRSLAAISAKAIREGKKVIYFTENTEINIPDVWRDFRSINVLDQLKPIILAVKTVTLSRNDSPMKGQGARGIGQVENIRTLPAKLRKELYLSEQWPAECNLIITNYSQFRGEDAPSRKWAKNALDKDTLLVLDESQNAISFRSHTGQAIRDMIGAVGRSNVIFSTATPMRNQYNGDLYKPLLPNVEGYRLNNILRIKFTGGESAEESFASMLAEDGVFLRRDHDLSNIDFQVRLPRDETIVRYQGIMDRFSPLIELVLDCSLRVSALVGQAKGNHYTWLLNNGFDRATAQTESETSNQYGMSPGSHLARLSRLMINAVKIDQVVSEVINEINEGRKPLISFHSTGEVLLNELVAAGNEILQSKELNLTLADQIRRVTDSIYKITIANEEVDARDQYEDIKQLAGEIDEKIDLIDPDLPVSPIDSLIDKLAEKEIKVGEISGRNLAYRDNKIIRKPNTGRQQIIERYNNGELDVLMYNMAGATGGSYHSSADFKDQRPRSLIEMETPLDIIKYVQSQGRSNRYGQVHRPRVVSVMTGLVPEMRIMQQRNCKLRAMGASVDGNRSHPLLLDDIPDFLNIIGDQAARQVIEANPVYARKLGFSGPISTDGEQENHTINFGQNQTINTSSSLSQSFANKVLSRSIVLNSSEQTELVDLLRYEFEAIVEELDSINANPLKPKELEGYIDIKANVLYSGQEIDHRDIDSSAFLRPLYIATGIHHFHEEPISSEELSSLVGKSRIVDGIDGFAPFGEHLESNLATYLQNLLPPGISFGDAIDNLQDQPYRFRRKFDILKRLVSLLKKIKPGIVIQIDDGSTKDTSLRTIVKLFPPKIQFAHLPQAYRIKIISPGDSEPSQIFLNRLVAMPENSIRFQMGLYSGENLRHLKEFNKQSQMERKTPVQILVGNHLAAIGEANQHRLGALSLFRDKYGVLQRGVVMSKGNVDLTKLPVAVPSGRVAIALTNLLIGNKLKGQSICFRVNSGKEEIVCIRLFRSRFDVHALRGYFTFPYEEKQFRPDGEEEFGAESFYSNRQELGKIFRVEPKGNYSGNATNLCFDFPEHRNLYQTIFSNLEGLPLTTDWWNRNKISEIIKDLESNRLNLKYSFLEKRENPVRSLFD